MRHFAWLGALLTAISESVILDPMQEQEWNGDMLARNIREVEMSFIEAKGTVSCSQDKTGSEAAR